MEYIISPYLSHDIGGISLKKEWRPRRDLNPGENDLRNNTYKDQMENLVCWVMVGLRLSEEPSKEKNEMKQLKAKVDDLQCAIITLILVVILLAGYITVQILQQPFIIYLADPRLAFVGVVVVLILFTLWLATSKGE
jgi:hypothetical protein